MKSSSPVRFLHISDIHLGCRQYHSKIRQRDFYLAFDSVISRYALPLEEGGKPQVDFVVIPGDLFDQRNLQPITLSRATDVLSRLKEANIPVFASEGNHDAARRHEPNEPSWYHFLCSEGFFYYLRDSIDDGAVVFEPWSDEDRSGGFYDFPNGIRIVGTQWYGAQAHIMIEKIVEGLAALPPARFTILMFHGGLTEYVKSLSGGVEYEQVLPLRKYVQYLALGHIHKNYTRQNWLFNPGSLEACKVGEYFEDNGAYRVTINEDGTCDAEHLMDYSRRPFIWLELSCDLINTPEELDQAVRELVEEEGLSKVAHIQEQWPASIPEIPSPICHLEFHGSLGFPFSKLLLSELEPWICDTLGACLFRVHNATVPRELGGVDAVPLSDGRINRSVLEEQVFSSLFLEDSRYRDIAGKLSGVSAVLKKQLLEEHFDDVDAFIEALGRLIEPTEVSVSSKPSEFSISSSEEDPKESFTSSDSHHSVEGDEDMDFHK